MDVSDILTYVICFAICIIGFIAKRKKVVEEEVAEEVPVEIPVEVTEVKSRDASYRRDVPKVRPNEHTRGCSPPTNGIALPRQTGEPGGGARRGLTMGTSLQENKTDTQKNILTTEPEGESEYAIHSAEEARRAIIYAEIMNRKY